MAKSITWTNEKRKLRDLKPWARNPRVIKNKQAERLVESVNDFGQVETLAIGPNDGELYNGHQRLSVLAGAYGLDYEVDVRVASRPLSEKERERLTVYLHRGATGDFDMDLLANEFEVDDLLSWGFDAFELGIEEPEADAGSDTEPQIDKAEELRTKWDVELGQTWQLGDHRLICGDCTDAATVARLMGGEKAEVVVTDPPYGIMALGGRRQTHAAKGIQLIENDDLTGDTLIRFLADFINLCPVKNESSFYVCYGWKSQSEFTQAMRDNSLTLRATITWVKNVFGLSAKNSVGYRPQTEFMYFATKSQDYNWKWNGGGTQSDAWFIDRPTEREGNHPTNKPIELPVKCIENSSDIGDIVYDPFLGSGTTLIACENLGRKCRAVELSPAYVAVALQRFADHTGIEPVLVK